jgi:hypothetical protein
MSWLAELFGAIASIPAMIVGEVVALTVVALLLLPFAFASDAIGNFIQRKWGWAARRTASRIAGLIAVAILLWLPIGATVIGVIYVIARAILQ